MEVPRRPQPSTFTLPLHSPASSRLEEVDPRRSESREEEEDEEEERDPASERPVPVIMEPPELEVTGAMASVSLEDRRRSEEEEEAARERAAQRQQLAVEELVQSERNYLRHLRLTTVTIRSNLQKLQVLTRRRGQWNSKCVRQKKKTSISSCNQFEIRNVFLRVHFVHASSYFVASWNAPAMIRRRLPVFKCWQLFIRAEASLPNGHLLSSRQ